MAITGEFATFFFTFMGFYWALLAVFRVPSRRSEQVLRSSEVVKLSLQERLELSVVKPLVEPVASIIPVSLDTELELSAELRQVGIMLSAKEYYAKAIIIAILSVFIPLTVSFLGMHPIIFFVTVLIPLIVFRHFSTEHTERLKEKRQKIFLMLPDFIRSILNSVSDTKSTSERELGFYGQVNLIKIFETYLEVAPEVIMYDLSLLITEAKSISVETALHRFSGRLRIPEINYLCDILIGLDRGQPQAEALAFLARDIDVRYIEARKAEMLKRPGEMKRAIVPLVLITIGVIFFVLASDLVSSISIFS